MEAPVLSFTIIGKLVDILNKSIYPVELIVRDGKIQAVNKINDTGETMPFISPGFVDSHVHIESSMLVPSEFARLAVVHGTVATVSDPHEIANVCGMKGVEFMIENGNKVPFKFNFGAPSCVPATVFETAGATLEADDVEALLLRDDIRYLSEMMNFPGVLYKDEQVMRKIEIAHRLDKPIDGHAPGLRGEQAKQYIEAGISTDHECFTAEEALDKLRLGMKILIREGSAAKNFEALVGLLNDYPERIMICSDDKHPDSLVEGHINTLCARAVAKGIDVFKVLQAACINPVKHYNLNVGLLKEGDPADFILLNDLESFIVQSTFIDGIKVSSGTTTNISSVQVAPLNNFKCNPKDRNEFETPAPGHTNSVDVIEALDGQLITNNLSIPSSLLKQNDGYLRSNVGEDVLKIVVVNRYTNAPVSTAWIKNFGFIQGAIASSVAHDSHNIIAVGVSESDILRAVNLLISDEGGICCVADSKEMMLSLPIAGLMSARDGYQVAEDYTRIDAMAKSMGSKLSAPFMTLSFMALLVIPHLKLSDLGLFNGDTFDFC